MSGSADATAPSLYLFKLRLIWWWLIFVRTHCTSTVGENSLKDSLTISADKLKPEYSLVLIFSSHTQIWVPAKPYSHIIVFRYKDCRCVTAEHTSRGFPSWKKVLVSLCLTSCVVARRHWFIALIGRLVRQPFGVCVVGGFVGFLVFDENFSHQLLGTGQGDTWLQLQPHTMERTAQSPVVGS